MKGPPLALCQGPQADSKSLLVRSVASNACNLRGWLRVMAQSEPHGAAGSENGHGFRGPWDTCRGLAGRVFTVRHGKRPFTFSPDAGTVLRLFDPRVRAVRCADA